MEGFSKGKSLSSAKAAMTSITVDILQKHILHSILLINKHKLTQTKMLFSDAHVLIVTQIFMEVIDPAAVGNFSGDRRG